MPVQDALGSAEGLQARQGQRQRRRRPRRIAIVKIGDELEIHRPLGRKQLITVLGLAETHIPKAEARLLYDDRTPKPTPEEIEVRRLERIYRAAATPPTRPDRDMRRTLRRLKRGE